MPNKTYNIGIGKTTRLPITPKDDYVPPTSMVRVISYGDQFIIGSVIDYDEEDNSIMMTFPMNIEVYYNSQSDEETHYEFVPYLRNLMKFDINNPNPVRFNLGQAFTVFEPTDHVMRNYIGTLIMTKAVKDEMDGVQEPEQVTVN